MTGVGGNGGEALLVRDWWVRGSEVGEAWCWLSLLHAFICYLLHSYCGPGPVLSGGWAAPVSSMDTVLSW